MQLTYGEMIQSMFMLGILVALWGIYVEVRKIGLEAAQKK